MNDDWFTKFFKYIEGFRGDMTSELAEIRKDIRVLRVSKRTGVSIPDL